VLSRHQILAVAIAVACLPSAALPGVPNNAHALPQPELRVDINHATIDELLHVPGMTPSWAGRIIRFRPYRTKDDLVQRGVLTGSVYIRIKDYLIAHRNAQ
jgi:DNA uptake protein ComE-like DNA-binding protein